MNVSSDAVFVGPPIFLCQVEAVALIYGGYVHAIGMPCYSSFLELTFIHIIYTINIYNIKKRNILLWSHYTIISVN